MSIIQRCFNKTISNIISPNDKIAIALSGGVDSMSLLNLLNTYNNTQQQGSLQITCITIDHDYRPTSFEEAKAITTLIPHTSIRHVTSKINWPNRAKLSTMSNFEEIARLKRYELMFTYCQQHGINKLLMGHTLNDQIETFIIRLLNNSSIFGLKCMSLSTTNSNIQILRPLLSIDKASLYQYCQQNNFNWFEDVTNTDIKLTRRNKIRHLLINDKISTREISKLINKVNEMTGLIEEKMSSLYKVLLQYNDLIIDEKYLSIIVNLHIGWFKNDGNDIIINRFLWCLNRQISPLDNYHYSYSSNLKIFQYIKSYINNHHPSVNNESSESINIGKLSSNSTINSKSKNNNGDDKFNLLGSIWQLSISDNFINIKISREPPRRTIHHHHHHNNNNRQLIKSQDFIYDNRLHIKTSITANDNLYLSMITKDDFANVKRFMKDITMMGSSIESITESKSISKSNSNSNSNDETNNETNDESNDDSNDNDNSNDTNDNDNKLKIKNSKLIGLPYILDATTNDIISLPTLNLQLSKFARKKHHFHIELLHRLNDKHIHKHTPLTS